MKSKWLKKAHIVMIICWLVLGLLDQPSGMEGFGAGAVYFLVLIISVVISSIFFIIALWKKERPIWLYFTVMLLIIIPVLGFFIS